MKLDITKLCGDKYNVTPHDQHKYLSKWEDIDEKTTLPNVDDMLDLRRGVNAIYDFLLNNYSFAIIGDLDSDGVSGAAFLYRSLSEVFLVGEDRLFVLTNERGLDRGVNKEAVEWTMSLYDKLDDKHLCVITVDHGSSDEYSFRTLANAGIRMIVTDHHIVGEENILPTIVEAFINPKREGNIFTTDISGATVAYILMHHLFNKVKENGIRAGIHIDELLPYISNTIVTDYMPMNSPINRYLFKKGIDIMDKQISRDYSSAIAHYSAPWIALDTLINLKARSRYIDENTIGFQIGPILNAGGRMKKSSAILEFLLSSTYSEALNRAGDVVRLNNMRKKKQTEKFLEATKFLEQVRGTVFDQEYIKVVVISDGDGVTGIVANDIAIKHNTSCFICTSSGDELFSCSGRNGGTGVNLMRVVEGVRNEDNDIIHMQNGLPMMGGHHGAMGMTIHKSQIVKFINRFNEKVESISTNEPPKINNREDVVLYSIYDIDDELMGDVMKLKPFGRDWEQPIFKLTCIVKQVKRIGKHALLYIVDPALSGGALKCFMPNVGDTLFNELSNMRDESNIINIRVTIKHNDIGPDITYIG